MGDKTITNKRPTITNKRPNRSYRPWIGGVVLFLVSIGLISLSVMKDPMEPSSDEKSVYAKQIPTGHTSVSGDEANTPDLSTQNRAVKLNPKKQRTLIEASLQRRDDSQGIYEREDKLSMPEWDKIINPGGSLKDDVNKYGLFGSNAIPDFVDLYDGVEAEFIQENISDGIATDMSALLTGPKLADEVLYNGPVRREHDLGNAYVLATVSTDTHLRLYAGVERIITDEGTFIEFEFNQNKVHLSSGSPWPIIGERKDGDLLVRMIFSNRTLQSVQFEQWQQGGFNFINTGAGISGDSCLQQRAFMYCVGTPPIQHPVEGFEVWDEDNNVLEPILANDFVEVGIDVELLVGPQVDFTSVLFRTPEDIAMNNFRVFQRVAQLDDPFATKTGLIQTGIYTKSFVGGQTD